MNDVDKCKNSVKNLKEMITYLKDENRKSEKKYKTYETLISMLDLVDTVVIIGSTTTTLTVSITGIGLINVPISAGKASSLSLVKKILYQIILKKYKKCRKQYQRKSTKS